MMKMLKVSFLISLMLLGFFGLSGCEADEAASSDSSAKAASSDSSVEGVGEPGKAYDIALIYSQRANSAADPSQVEGDIENAVKGEQFLACILADGNPQLKSDKFELTESNGRRRDDEIQDNVNKILNLNWTAQAKEVDIFKAIRLANSAFGSSEQTDADNLLIVVDSGISTTGAIDFTKDATRAGLLDPEWFVDALRKSGDLAKLENINEVIWVDMGKTNDPQGEVNEGTKKAMQNLYRAVFNAAGIDKINFVDGANTSTPTSDVPAVTEVNMPRIATDENGEPVGIGDTLELSESGEKKITFKTGTADFADPDSANEALSETIDQLKDFPNTHATITGYTDTVGSSKTNLALSKKRAKAVMNLMVTAGVKKSQLTAVGKGETDEYGKGSQPKNRRVDIKLDRIQS